MRVSRLMMVVPCVLLMSVPVFAQQAPAAPAPTMQRYVAALGGAALSSDAAVTMGVEYGERVSKHAGAFVNYQYYDDLMSSQMKDTLTLAGTQITSATRVTRTFSGRDRGLAFTAGAKFGPTSGGVQPFAGGAVGGLNLRRTITEASLGDVTASFASQTGLGDGVVTAGQTTATKALVMGIVGVRLVKKQSYVDVTYRYGKAFHGTTIDFSQVTVGLGVAF